MLQLPPTLRDLLALAARLLLGVVLLAHGYQKLVGQGLGATSASFARLGVPMPGLRPPSRAASRPVAGSCWSSGC